MKLSDLRPCDSCRQPVLKPGASTFVVARISPAMVDPRAAQAVIGTSMIAGGSLRLGEVMAPAADEAIMVLEEKDAQLGTTLLICLDCYCGVRREKRPDPDGGQPISHFLPPRALGSLVEERNASQADRAEQAPKP